MAEVVKTLEIALFYFQYEVLLFIMSASASVYVQTMHVCFVYTGTYFWALYSLFESTISYMYPLIKTLTDCIFMLSNFVKRLSWKKNISALFF